MDKTANRESWMGWYRVCQGLPYDARLGVVARRSGLTRAEALGLYIFLFDTASRGAAGGRRFETRSGRGRHRPRYRGRESGGGSRRDARKRTGHRCGMPRGLGHAGATLDPARARLPQAQTGAGDPDSPAAARERRERLGSGNRAKTQHKSRRKQDMMDAPDVTQTPNTACWEGWGIDRKNQQGTPHGLQEAHSPTAELALRGAGGAYRRRVADARLWGGHERRAAGGGAGNLPRPSRYSGRGLATPRRTGKKYRARAATTQPTAAKKSSASMPTGRSGARPRA